MFIALLFKGIQNLEHECPSVKDEQIVVYPYMEYYTAMNRHTELHGWTSKIV